MKARTLAILSGEDPAVGTGALVPPIVTSTSFAVTPGDVGFSAADMSEGQPYFYTRWANPTLAALETKLAALEGAEACVSFASGMAAATGLMLHILSSGDRLVVSDVCYAGLAEFVRETLTRFGVEVLSVDLSDLEALRSAIGTSVRLVYAETPANPILKLCDVPALAKMTHAAGGVLAVDSTIATPIGLRPLEMGADFVVHSLTKYACGHGDAIGGAVLGSSLRMADLRRDSLVHLGAVMSPHAAAAILRGLQTLPIRMKLHQENALAVSRYLESLPQVSRVLYPGLASHPQHALAERQMTNCSGLISFVLPAAADHLSRIAERLRIIVYAVSFGKCRSLIYYIPTADVLRTSFQLDPTGEAGYRNWAGDGLFRLSVGLEDPDDLIEDLENALKQ